MADWGVVRPSESLAAALAAGAVGGGGAATGAEKGFWPTAVSAVASQSAAVPAASRTFA